MDYRKIDFEQELDTGPETYNKTLGKWWLNQSNNRTHGYAYRKIAEHLSSFFGHPPKRIIDYGCGGGHMLTRLYRRFPDSQLIGIDGSSLMLEVAGKRLQYLGREWEKRVELIETELPKRSSTAASDADSLAISPQLSAPP